MPKMDQDFYRGVEELLSSGPPSQLAKIGGSKKKGDVEVARALNKAGNSGKKNSGAAAKGLTQSKKSNIVSIKNNKGGMGIRRKQQPPQPAKAGWAY